MKLNEFRDCTFEEVKKLAAGIAVAAEVVATTSNIFEINYIFVIDVGIVDVM